MLSSFQQSGQTMLRAAVALLLLGCMVLSCLQMTSSMAMADLPAGASAHHGMADTNTGQTMAHDCCTPDSSHCPLEIPLAKLFSSLDTPQFIQLFWLLPLAASLLALSLLRQLLYRLSPLPVWRSYLPSYPRLHIQQEVFLN